MKYNNGALTSGQFLKRYKRFFADVQVGGQTVVAHVANTGSLKGVCDTPHDCRIEFNDNPERKLKYTLMQVKTANSWVGVNTHLANQLVWEAWQNKKIPHWLNFTECQREYKISKESRLDFCLSNTTRKHFVEVKSVTYAQGNVALFPDAVTTRGQKHLKDLMGLISKTTTAEILFVIQRTDCTEFSPAEDIDPEYARLLREAQAAGVTLSAYSATPERDRIELNNEKKITIVANPKSHR